MSDQHQQFDGAAIDVAANSANEAIDKLQQVGSPFGKGTALQCKAIRKNGERCKNPAVKGREVCRNHGGLNPGGIASPHFKHGKHSKFLPARLLGNYAQAQNDPDFLGMSAELSLLDTRIFDLLERVDRAESGAAWKKLEGKFEEFKKAWNAFHLAWKTGKSDDILENLATMGSLIHGDLQHLINHGVGDYDTWREISTAIEHRRRLVESERKRQLDMKQYVTADQTMNLVVALSEAVKRHVTDRTVLHAISRDLAILLNRPDPTQNHRPGSGDSGG